MTKQLFQFSIAVKRQKILIKPKQRLRTCFRWGRMDNLEVISHDVLEQ